MYPQESEASLSKALRLLEQNVKSSLRPSHKSELVVFSGFWKLHFSVGLSKQLIVLLYINETHYLTIFIEITQLETWMWDFKSNQVQVRSYNGDTHKIFLHINYKNEK